MITTAPPSGGASRTENGTMKKIEVKYLKTWSTGKVHKTYGGNTTFCNHSGQIRSISGHIISEKVLDQTPEHMLCKKCFG
jgi:hypothetical protein